MTPVKTLARWIASTATLFGIGAFCVFLSLPLAAMVFRNDESDLSGEKRTLHGLPAFPDSIETLGEYPTAFEEFFDDRFGFRRTLLRLNSFFHVLGLGISSTDKVILGDEGWLYLVQDALDNYRGLPGKSTAREWREVLRKRRDLLADQGIEYVLVIAPDKHTIYPEHIPDRYNRIKDSSFLDDLYLELESEPSVNTIDLRPALVDGKRLGQIYDRTGTHWNLYGGYLASTEILARLGERFPGIGSAMPLSSPFDCHDTIPRKGDDLARMMELHYSDLFIELPTINYTLPPGVIYSGDPIPCSVKGGQNFKQLNKNGSLPKGLVIRDSFGSALRPFLAAGFSELTYIWREDFRIDDIRDYDVDIVIEELVERFLMRDCRIIDSQETVLRTDKAIIEKKHPRAGQSIRLTINNETRPSVFAMPPSVITFSDLTIAPENDLYFSYALAEQAWSRKGDGVEFSIEIRENKNEPFSTIYANRIDPIHNREDRKWFDCRLSLERFENKTVDLRFKTDPAGNDLNDMAVWSRLSIR